MQANVFSHFSFKYFHYICLVRGNIFYFGDKVTFFSNVVRIVSIYRKNRSTSYNFETTFLILLGIHYVVLKEHFIVIDMYIQLPVTCCVICAQECKDVRKLCLLGQLVSRYSTKTVSAGAVSF
jgi:hypothetical protein